MNKPRFSQLNDWLAWLETLHPKAIDLGLARVYHVAHSLQLLAPATSISHEYSGALSSLGSTNSTDGASAIGSIHNNASPKVVTVSGTNGKGSCVATVEQFLLAGQHSVGCYTSPHLHHYCERIRINGSPVGEQQVCDAFAAIDAARGDTSLTYFEFGTLAALWIFVQQGIPFVVLEVGLGGRLDAVNIVDADIAVVTSIAVDHEEWLGSDREIIAQEKLGVTRTSQTVVIGEPKLTRSLEEFIAQHPRVCVIERDFSAVVDAQHWSWSSTVNEQVVAEYSQLPKPALPLNSVLCALQVVCLLDQCPEQALVEQVLTGLSLPGRFQQQSVDGHHLIFDVAHNAAAASWLAQQLTLPSAPITEQTTPSIIAVFAAMADKDIDSIIEPLSACFRHWHIGVIPELERAASTTQMEASLQQFQQTYSLHDNIQTAYHAALNQAQEHDRIVIFGSFFTVAAIQAEVLLQ